MATTITDYMEMTLGEVSVTLGPEWASLINQALLLIDAHDHSEGKGSPVTPAGMLINDDLDFNGNNPLNASAASFQPLGSADTAIVGSLQRVGGNLYWVNSAGQAVQITSGSAVVSTGSGVFSLSLPGAYPYTVVSGDAQSVLGIDTASARTVNLPSATTAMFFQVKDITGSAQTNNISVTPDGTDLIDNVNSAFVIAENYGCRGFISDGVSKWYVI